MKNKNKKKEALPFNRCQINKTIKYSANRATETSVMFNVRENDPTKAAILFQKLTDEYYRKRQKSINDSKETSK